MNRLILTVLLLLVFAPGFAADIPVQGAWTDATVWTVNDVPEYQARCQINSTTIVYENLALPAPAFSEVLVFEPTDVLSCQVRTANVAIPTLPIYSAWSPWTVGIQITAPSGASNIILIYQLP